MTHWHTYSWTGRERPSDNLRIDPHGDYPPLETDHWLDRAPRLVRLTSADPDEVLVWLKEQLTVNPPLETDMPVDRRLHWAGEFLGQKSDVVWGYYTNSSYIARAAIACPKPGHKCPQP